MATQGRPPIKSLKFTVMIRSKWLKQDESSVFCNVMETGDILELEMPEGNHWGIGLRIENSSGKGPETIEVASLEPHKGTECKHIIRKEKLQQFWIDGTKIRINNHSDRTQQYHDGEQIRKQVEYALHHTTKKWPNSKHFVHWCRHGEKAPEHKRKDSDITKWGSISATAGVWMFMKNRKRHNTE